MNKENVRAGIYLTIIVMFSFFPLARVYGQFPDIVLTNWLNSYCDYLGISPEQTESIRNLQDKFLKETASNQNELNTHYLAFQTMFNQPTADNAAIIAKRNEIVAMQQKLRIAVQKYGLEAKAVLTPEQLSLLPPGCTMEFLFGRGYGMGRGFVRGIGRGYGRGMGGVFGRGMSRGFGRGIGRGYGRGMGRGFGRGW